MKINKITYQHRRDFRAIYECEGCGHKVDERGYDDANFHENVIPSARWRANNSIRGRSPKPCVIRLRTSSGFFECFVRSAITSCFTLLSTLYLFGCPRTPSKHSSTLPIVHLPKFEIGLLFLLTLDQQKATVLYVNPHAFMVSIASGSCGDTAHKNKMQSLSANSDILSDFIQLSGIV